MPGIASGSIPHLTVRAVLFLLWLVLGNDWLTRHMGIGFNSPILVAGVGVLGIGFGVLESATGEKFKDIWLGKLVQKLLNFPVLVWMYAALFVALSNWSSVAILNDPANTAFDATLTPAGKSGGTSAHADNKDAPSSPVQFTRVWVGPMGRPYRLEVKGYLPQMITVYPVAGVSLSPRRDLRVAPSVLLRPPFDALPPMAGGVRFAVWMETPKGRIAVADATVTKHSVLVGAEQPISSTLLEQWRLGAVADRITNESLLAQLLECWKKPLVVTPANLLEPGRVIRAVVYNPSGQPLAEVRALLTDDRLQDVPMELSSPIPAASAGSKSKEEQP